MELYGAAEEDETNVDLATGVVKFVTEVVVELEAGIVAELATGVIVLDTIVVELVVDVVCLLK